jgi:beta-galactosidase GanA
MTDKVISLRSPEKTPEELLDECKEVFQDFMIMGYDEDGNFNAALTKSFADGGDILWALELFKHNLMVGSYAE